VPELVRPYGGRILARGGRYRIMAGPHHFERYVLIEFPTFAQGVACFESPEYQAASVFRIAGGEVETVIVEGLEASTPTASAARDRRSP
jgi:uncharacterized protein (DUF1330 family)